MKKISLIMVMVVSLLLACSVSTQAQTRASEYLSGYRASIQCGANSGEILINFVVQAEKSVPKIGALKIDIYRTSGDRAATIYGTTSNGLLSPKSGRLYAHSYTYKGIPTVSYYAVVTVCAGPSTNYDTRIVKTSVVQAPK